MFRYTLRPYRCASVEIILATAYGCMYAGWIATREHNLSVDSMMTCDTSQGSSWLLSVTTRTPSCPAPSLERANSCSSRVQVSDGALAERGQVEKIFRSCSRACIAALRDGREKVSKLRVGNCRAASGALASLLRSVHRRCGASCQQVCR